MTRDIFLKVGLIVVLALNTTAQSIAFTTKEDRHKAESLIQQLEKKYLSNEVPIIIKKLEDNVLPDSILQAFALEQHLIIQSDLRSNALSLHRFGGSSSQIIRQFFTRLVTGEVMASEQLPALIKALEISDKQINEYQPLAGAQAYPAYTTWLANYAMPAEIAAALLINFQSFGKNVGRMAKALKQNKKMSDSQLAFLISFRELPPGFREQVIDIVAKGLASGISELNIETRVRLIQSYEKEFWRALENSGDTKRNSN
ncbi:hypothetical protein [Microbulbifer variabilis]|uniref:hypothetical protein n=1 Tax=Microbulbifer variabilis TaxID=266805 RepID=UPI00035E00CA|nr:hypothetical protein [Microbulbifer variabilis]